MDKAKVVIIGASGHGRVIADIIESCGDELMGFLDDRSADCFPGEKILGKIIDAPKMAQGSVQFVIGIGDNKVRRRLATELRDLQFYTAIHPSAVIAKEVKIGAGTVVMANAVINTGSIVGKHCIVNTAATVDHDNQIGDFVHISPGAHTAGTVSIGEGTWLGIGAVVSNNLNICGGCTIGAGAVVIRDITEVGVYAGVPLRSLRQKDNQIMGG